MESGSRLGGPERCRANLFPSRGQAMTSRKLDRPGAHPLDPLQACFLFAALFLFTAFARGADVRHKELFDFGWRFHLGDSGAAMKADFDDSGWRSIDLPHDWSIEGPYDQDAPSNGSGGFLPTGLGLYRKAFVLLMQPAAILYWSNLTGSMNTARFG